MKIKKVKSTAFKILRSKRGISPILATLLLIVIAVAAITVTYAWIMTYMGSTTEQAGVILYKANVSFETGKMVIDIGNSGTSDTQLIAAYVGESSTTMQSKTTVPATPISLSAGSIATFNVTLSWTNSQTYYFKVVPSAGQQALTFEAKAPAA
jgi:flagellin-like protein